MQGEKPYDYGAHYSGQNARWGQSQVIKGAELLGMQQNQTARDMLKNEDMYPALRTITLQGEPVGPTDSGETPLLSFPYAEIVFGCGGITQTVEIDWIPGCRLSWVFDAVSVRARIDPNPYPDTFEPRDVRLNVSMGEYPIGASRTFRTKYIGDLAGPGSVDVKVPPSARRVWAIGPDSEKTLASQLRAYSRPNSPILEELEVLLCLTNGLGMALPNGTTHVEWDKAGGADLENIGLLFEIQL